MERRDGLLGAALLRDADDGVENQDGEDDGRVDKGTPAALLLEEGEDEGDGSGSEEYDDQLVLELLEDELPDRGRRLFGDGCCLRCGESGSQLGGRGRGKPFFPCLAR